MDYASEISESMSGMKVGAFIDAVKCKDYIALLKFIERESMKLAEIREALKDAALGGREGADAVVFLNRLNAYINDADLEHFKKTKTYDELKSCEFWLPGLSEDIKRLLEGGGQGGGGSSTKRRQRKKRSRGKRRRKGGKRSRRKYKR